MLVIKMIMLVTHRAIWVTQLCLFSAGTSTVVAAGSENWSLWKYGYDEDAKEKNIFQPISLSSCVFLCSGKEGRLWAVWTRLRASKSPSSLPVIASVPLLIALVALATEKCSTEPELLLWFSRWFRRGIWLKSPTPRNANPTNPKLLIAKIELAAPPLVVLLTKLTLCVILNLLVSSCSFLLLNRWIAKFITERRCDRVELDFHANRAIRMSIQSIAMHYMCFLFLSTDALNSLKMFSHSGWR